MLVHFRNDPDRVRVGHISDSDHDRTVVLKLTPEEAADAPVVAVYTWDEKKSIFSGQLSHVFQLETPPSTSECLFCVDITDVLASDFLTMQQKLWIPIMHLICP